MGQRAPLGMAVAHNALGKHNRALPLGPSAAQLVSCPTWILPPVYHSPPLFGPTLVQHLVPQGMRGGWMFWRTVGSAEGFLQTLTQLRDFALQGGNCPAGMASGRNTAQVSPGDYTPGP